MTSRSPQTRVVRGGADSTPPQHRNNRQHPRGPARRRPAAAVPWPGSCRSAPACRPRSNTRSRVPSGDHARNCSRPFVPRSAAGGCRRPRRPAQAVEAPTSDALRPNSQRSQLTPPRPRPLCPPAARFSKPLDHPVARLRPEFSVDETVPGEQKHGRQLVCGPGCRHAFPLHP